VAELRRQGYRATPQRALVLKVLEENQGHMSAEEIGQAVDAAAVPLNRSTVYRTLETLTALGMVKATRMGRSTYYEMSHSGDEHHHLVCTGCRRTIDLPTAEVERVVARQASKAGFSISEIEVLVSGLCPDCRGSASLPASRGTGGDGGRVTS
jgi:Fur family ferric uptake transcriptional regulator